MDDSHRNNIRAFRSRVKGMSRADRAKEMAIMRMGIFGPLLMIIDALSAQEGNGGMKCPS